MAQGLRRAASTLRAFSGAALTSAVLLSAAGVGAAPPAPPPLEAYGELPAVEAMAISPSGNGIATVSRIHDQRQLLVVGSQGSVRVQADVGDTKVWGLEFAGEDIVLLHNSATQTLGPTFTADLYEFSGTLIVPLDGGKAQLAFARTQSTSTAVMGRYGVRQSAMGPKAYLSTVKLAVGPGGPSFVHGRPTLYEVDLTRNSASTLAQPGGDGHRRSWLVDAAGRVAATLDISEANGRWRIDNSEGQGVATGATPSGDIDLLSLGHDGTTFLYQITDADGASHVLEVPLAGGTAREVFADEYVTQTFTDPTNGHLLGYVVEGERPAPVFFDPARQAAANKIFKAFAKYRPSLVDWTPDFAKFIVRTSGNGDSGTYYVVDVTALKADAIGFERPRIEPEQVGPISVIDYRAADGLAMNGILTLPPGREARSLPVILLPHGGPHASDKAEFDWWAQAFASRGYAVFQPNFRGSTNRDDAFRNASANEWGRKMQTDISDGLAELVRRGIVDPKRACIVGASYGRYAALAGVTLQQGIYRCAVAVAPVADLELLFSGVVRESGFSPMTGRALRKDLGDPKNFDAVSPKRHAKHADAPILLIHGKDDTVVPFRHSEAMANALRAAQKPYELVVLKHEDHWLSSSETRLQMLTESMRFVQQHNPAD